MERRKGKKAGKGVEGNTETLGWGMEGREKGGREGEGRQASGHSTATSKLLLGVMLVKPMGDLLLWV